MNARWADVQRQLGIVVGTTTGPFDLKYYQAGQYVTNCWLEECALGNFQADAIRDYSKTQIGIIDASAIR